MNQHQSHNKNLCKWIICLIGIFTHLVLNQDACKYWNAFDWCTFITCNKIEFKNKNPDAIDSFRETLHVWKLLPIGGVHYKNQQPIFVHKFVVPIWNLIFYADCFSISINVYFIAFYPNQLCLHELICIFVGNILWFGCPHKNHMKYVYFLFG